MTFEDSIADCTRTDYVRLGAMTLAKSEDQFANPANDTDSDGINDCMEQQLGLNPADASDAAADRDGDGLSNLQEFRSGTSLAAADTDHDGVSDFQETNQYLTDPTLADIDGDGLNDGVEAGNPNVDPVLADKDHDGVSDYWELQLGTNPGNPADARQDSDGDGFSNRQESLLGFDPTRAVASPTRGRQAWSFEAVGRISTSGAIGPDGTIYVIANYENLYAINPDGTQRWRYTVAQRSLSAPVVGPDGIVYVAVLGSGGAIHAINPDGSLRWNYAVNNPAGVVLGTAGRVYFTAYTISAGPSGIDFFGRWGSLDGGSGQFVAGAVLNDAVTYAPAVAANGNVYLIDASGVMRGYSVEGTLLWTQTIVGDLSEPAAAPVIGAGQKIYFSDDFGRTYAVSPQGQILWTRQSPDQQTFSTVTVGTDGTLYIGAYDSKLYAVNDLDGRFMNVDPVGFVESNPMSFNRYAYVNNNPYKYVDPDGEFLNFAAKFVLDVGINVAFNYVTTGKMDLGGALKESAIGILNPAKTVANVGKLGLALAKAGKKAGMDPTCVLSCFAAGTTVLAEDGFVAIETLKEGDLVWAHDPDTGETRLKPVVRTFVNTKDSIWELTLEKQGTRYRHEVTGSHPYYVVGEGWVEVAQLRVGAVLQAEGESTAIVTALRDTGEVVTTYNLEVADIHTYYVSAAKVLVHNCRRGMPVLKAGSKAWEAAVDKLSSLKKGAEDFRTRTATEAKRLLKEARGNMDRRKQYGKDPYRKGYEMHNDQNTRELDVGNDLQHVKWKDGKAGGHIFYDKPN